MEVTVLPESDHVLESLEVGGSPIVRHFVERLGLDRHLERALAGRRLGRRPKVSSAQTLSVMLSNILLSRLPLYAVGDWLRKQVPEHFGLVDREGDLMNDDRIARALDDLYESDRASLLTTVVTHAVKEFDIALDQIHNDTTSITFTGAYGRKARNSRKPPPRITYGHNKDHRPDLKQLVYGLSITADGAVPVYCHVYDGNMSDDQTHVETWSILHKIVGNPDFIYVADSKLANREAMGFISGQGGKFVTVLPRTRKEDAVFREYARNEFVPWQEVRRGPNKRRRTGPPSVYVAFEPESRSSEGYRVVWYRSSDKAREDESARLDHIASAKAQLFALEIRRGRHRLRTEESALAAADKILVEEGAERWLRVSTSMHTVSTFRPDRPGRPGKTASCRRVEATYILFGVEEIADAIQRDARCDGIFPLITNIEGANPQKLLEIYKYQPFLEKRHEQLKSGIEIAPVNLKLPERVAALLFLYFLALLILALIEREVRLRMREEGISSLPLYPEKRYCVAPTTEVILDAVAGLRRHRLRDTDGRVVKLFHDAVTPAAKRVLRLLHVNRVAYGLT